MTFRNNGVEERLRSHVPAIAEIEFRPWPTGKGCKPERVVRVGHDVYGLSSTGIVYASNRLTSYSGTEYRGRMYDHIDSGVLRALVRLDVITEAEADCHRHRQRAFEAIDWARSELKWAKNSAKRASLTIRPEVRRILDQAISVAICAADEKHFPVPAREEAAAC